MFESLKNWANEQSKKAEYEKYCRDRDSRREMRDRIKDKSKSVIDKYSNGVGSNSVIESNIVKTVLFGGGMLLASALVDAITGSKKDKN